MFKWLFGNKPKKATDRPSASSNNRSKDEPLGSIMRAILVSGVDGEKEYLSRLRDPDGHPISYIRTGSTSVEGRPHILDVYKITSQNGEKTYGVLHMNMHAPPQLHTKKAPPGFTLVDEKFAKTSHAPQTEPDHSFELGLQLRDNIRRDFGVNVCIEGGAGTFDIPYKIEPISGEAAAKTQMQLINCIARGQNVFWRLQEWSPVEEALPTQAVRYETIAFTPDEVETTKIAIYFDTRSVDGYSIEHAPVTAWEDEETGLKFPFELGWLHFSRKRRYEVVSDGGEASEVTTLEYTGPGAHGEIDIRPEGGRHSKRTAMEALEQVCQGYEKMNPDAQSPWPAKEIDGVAMRFYLAGEDIECFAFSTKQGGSVRLFAKFFDDGHTRQMLQDSIKSFGRIF